jgi:hypothetical protein
MKTSSKVHIINNFKKVYKESKNQLSIFKPLVIEMIIFMTYILLLGVFFRLIWWQLITFFYVVILGTMLVKIVKKSPKQYIRFKLHIILNIILLTIFFISMICFSRDKQFDVYTIVLILNSIIQIEYGVYSVLSAGQNREHSKLLASHPNISSSSLTALLFIVASLIVLITKDNWLIIGLLGAFINHILNAERLLSFKYKNESEIVGVIKKYRLEQKFWIIKGIGFAFILSWGASIFLFKQINQGIVIVGGMYLCLAISFLIYFLVNTFFMKETTKNLIEKSTK